MTEGAASRFVGGGAQRWLRGDVDVAQLREAAAGAGGHATLFRGGGIGDSIGGIAATVSSAATPPGSSSGGSSGGGGGGSSGGGGGGGGGSGW